MAKKKSFSIGHSLTQALSDTVNAAKNYAGGLHIEVIPLQKIEIDPDNPRDLSLNITDVCNGLSSDDSLYERKLREKDALTTITHSIKEQGILNPIIVYKQGEKYRIIAGERRTLASILAGKEDIQAKVLDEKPDPLKLGLLQWIENMEREDLSLWERTRNLEKIIGCYAQENKIKTAQVSATALSQLLGCSLQQAINYKSVLDAPAKLRSAIQENQIRNLEKAVAIVKAPIKLQDYLIDLCKEGATLKKLKALASQSQIQPQKLKKDGRGRQATRVNFGATQHIHVAKMMMESILQSKKLSHLHHRFKHIDWQDYKAVTESFKTLIKMLEKIDSPLS